ncbi:MAG: hypothetical protein FWE82_04410, partial [Defluviitaleaceae bacterium]|nr:hypothetical protein [Defluviitaleaceae bacterium]
WEGTKTTVNIEEYFDHKGLSYSQYFLTMPGLPVMCHYASFTNNTGAYKHCGLYFATHIGHPTEFKLLTVSAKDDQKIEYRYRAGVDDTGKGADRLITIEASDQKDKLNYFLDGAGSAWAHFGLDNKIVYLNSNSQGQAENGGTYTTRPMFYIFTDAALTADGLSDLASVVF